MGMLNKPAKRPTQRDVDAARQLEQQRSRDVQREQKNMDNSPPPRKMPDSEPWRPGRDRAHP